MSVPAKAFHIHIECVTHERIEFSHAFSAAVQWLKMLLLLLLLLVVLVCA